MITVKLKKFALGRYEDASPFPLGDLTIKIEGLPLYEGAEMRFVAKVNNSVVARLAVTEQSNTVTVNQELLDCGEFKAAVIVYSKGVKVEEYAIEPLTITAVDGSFFADPFITALTKKAESIEKQVAELKKSSAGQIEKLTKQIAILIEFAKACIAAIPYISDLSVSDFNIEEDDSNE